MRAVVVGLLFAVPALAQGPPKVVLPDDATRALIRQKTADLWAKLKAVPDTTPGYADVAVYAKAGEWIERHGEYYGADAGKKTLAVLDAGLKRVADLKDGNAPWQFVRRKPTVRGYKSFVDGSYQPYSVTLPAGYNEGRKKWPIDIVLHGRDGTLTEVKFLAAKEAAKFPPDGPDRIVLDVYGRGNNAYRWAGETDVFEAFADFHEADGRANNRPALVDYRRKVIRGFSMGGAGTWHLGLHHPFEFAAMQPGAGFTVTRGYTKLPDALPEYVEKCLRIYDAADYAENAFNIPVVAYSGEIDKQKAAADNVAARLKDFREPVKFTHLVAPGLEHKQPPEWVAKADAELAKVLPRTPADRVRFVTYTTAYSYCPWVEAQALDRHYDRTVVDATRTADGFAVTTTNVRVLSLSRGGYDELFDGSAKKREPKEVVIDGQKLDWPTAGTPPVPKIGVVLAKAGGKWAFVNGNEWMDGRKAKPEKVKYLSGPIDDAFRVGFVVVRPTRTTGYPAAAFARFETEWDKYLRGALPTISAEEYAAGKGKGKHVVLFGDSSDPHVADVVKKLPITWTTDTLVVNGVTYDPKTHVPAMIYPNPAQPYSCVVLNSGHTFHAADFEGTNALLYPRLGDWAVLRPNPTAKDPANADVAAAGLFDEFWKFPAK